MIGLIKVFYSILFYANNLIFIFMNINENI